MRQAFPDYPDEASMVVSGTYNGTPFTVYFDAEIEVEQEFPTPLQVAEDGTITVQLDPGAWFMMGGEPMDLSAFDGQTIGLEVEFEDAVEVEFEDD